MTEKYYCSKILEEIGRKPKINNKASNLRKLLWLNIAITSIAVLQAKGLMIVSIVILLFAQIYFLQLLYLWLKYETGFYKFWIFKNSNPVMYWLNITVLAIVYMLASLFPLWAIID